LHTKINTVVLSIVGATLLMLSIGTAGLTTTVLAEILYNHFTAKLSGSNEIPPVNTPASGIASFEIVPIGHQEVLNYELNLKNIKGVTGAHIHSGKQDENGPVVAGLFNPNMSRPPTGPINGLLTAGTLTSSELTGPLAHKTIDILVNMIRSSNAYVNVHTTQNQNGEVRGQIS
jgi:CHRD domain